MITKRQTLPLLFTCLFLFDIPGLGEAAAPDQGGKDSENRKDNGHRIGIMQGADKGA